MVALVFYCFSRETNKWCIKPSLQNTAINKKNFILHHEVPAITHQQIIRNKIEINNSRLPAKTESFSKRFGSTNLGRVWAWLAISAHVRALKLELYQDPAAWACTVPVHIICDHEAQENSPRLLSTAWWSDLIMVCWCWVILHSPALITSHQHWCIVRR